MNTGGQDLTIVQLKDDQSRIILEEFSLKNGETKAFTYTIIATESLVLAAEAIASLDYQGDMYRIIRKAQMSIEVKK
jgi:hypothetical protein